MSAPPLSNQRAIVDRRKLAQTIGETIGEADGDGRSARDAVLTLLRKALENGRTELSRRLAEHPSGKLRLSSLETISTMLSTR